MSGPLTPALLRLIDEQRFGYVATVNADGGPNVSPKGTFLALDDRTLAFAEMRSPATVENIGRDMRVEVNMVDVFARKGARFRGVARFVARGEREFENLLPRWAEHWPDFADRFNGLVLVTVESVRPLTSPAYDIGATERELREQYLAKHTEIQRKHLDG